MATATRARACAFAMRRGLPGVSVNDLTDPDVVEPVSGNAVLNGVPVTVEPLVVAAAEAALAGAVEVEPAPVVERS